MRKVSLICMVPAAIFFAAIQPAIAQNCQSYWTAAYKCLEGCGPCPDDANGGGPAEPADPSFDARNRIRALIGQYGDILGQSTWSQVNFDGDANLQAGLDGLHHQIWQVLALANAESAGRRQFIADYANWIAKLEVRAAALNLVREDRLPQTIADARDAALAEKQSVEAAVTAAEQSVEDETARFLLAQQYWGRIRDETLLALKTALPDLPDLPPLYGETGDLPWPPQPFARKVLAGPEPVEGFALAPLTGPGGLPPGDISFQRVFTPAPEPASAPDPAARVSELEQLAAFARTAKTELESAKSASAAFRTQFETLSNLVHDGEGHVFSAKFKTEFARKQTVWLRRKLEDAQAQAQNYDWLKIEGGTRAALWDIFKEKVVMPAIEKTPHLPDAERAEKVLDLARQVRGLEGDFELFSTQSAGINALGPASQTSDIITKILGAPKDQAEETIDRTMAVIDAPPALTKAWKTWALSAP